MTASAVHVLDEWDEDAPIPYALTDAGWADAGHLPAGPVLQQIRLRGGTATIGIAPGSAEEKALERAQDDGWLTWMMADRLAVEILGLTPWELWNHGNSSIH